jgi:hypothetical protein
MSVVYMYSWTSFTVARMVQRGVRAKFGNASESVRVTSEDALPFDRDMMFCSALRSSVRAASRASFATWSGTTPPTANLVPIVIEQTVRHSLKEFGASVSS